MVVGKIILHVRKVVSPKKCDQEGSNQSLVVSTNSTRIVISYK